MRENLAKIVTKENVTKALVKFSNSKNLNLKASSGYDVIYKNERYPPKEVIREAARMQKIKINDDLHTLIGGSPTNKYLERMGFEIVEKEVRSNFTIDVKVQFITWMIANDGIVNNYFTKQFGAKDKNLKKELDEYERIYKVEFKKELFIVDVEGYKDQIESIKKNI